MTVFDREDIEELVKDIQDISKYFAEEKISIDEIVLNETEHKYICAKLYNLIIALDDYSYNLWNKSVFSKKMHAEILENETTELSEQIKASIKKQILKKPNCYAELVRRILFGNESFNANEGLVFCFAFNSKQTIREEFVYFSFKNDNFYILTAEEMKEYPFDFFIHDFIGHCEESKIDEFKAKVIYAIKNKTKKLHEIQNIITQQSSCLCKEIAESFEMSEGSVTFCDFLGWKGLWRDGSKNSLKTVSQLISSIEKEVARLTEKIIPLSKYFRISKLISISDTIAILTPKVYNVSCEQIIELHGKIGKYIIEACIKELPIRGAISYGQYNFSNNVMIGPAIDEAASWHEQADWLGIILTPRAQFVIEDGQNNAESSSFVFYNDIPLKGHKGLNRCVFWEDKDYSINKLIKNTKALTPEIACKYINTRRFLEKSTEVK